MKHMFYYLSIFILILFLNSCNNATESEFNYIYPIHLGNTWIYEGTFVVEMYETSNSSNNSSINMLDTVVVDSFYSEVDNIFKFKTIHNEDTLSESFTSYQYISNGNEGLRHHGYESPDGTWSFPRLVNNEKKYIINNLEFTHKEMINIIFQRMDDITWENEPLISIQYPFSLGDQWTYRNEDFPWRMDRLVTKDNKEEFTIQTLYDIDNDLFWDDYMNVFHTFSYQQGLIKIESIMDSVTFMGQHGEVMGSGQIKATMNLVDHELF